MQNFEDSFLLALALCIAFGFVGFLVGYRRHRGGQSWRRAWSLLVRPIGLAMSVSVVLAFTVYTPHLSAVWEDRQRYGFTYFNGSLVPFRTITSYLASTPSFNVLVQLAGNVLLFVPLGFFLAFGRKLRFGKALAIGLLVALLVETWQWLIGRTVDIDDVILNGIGVALGAAIAIAASKLGRMSSGGVSSAEGTSQKSNGGVAGPEPLALETVIDADS